MFNAKSNGLEALVSVDGLVIFQLAIPSLFTIAFTIASERSIASILYCSPLITLIKSNEALVLPIVKSVSPSNGAMPIMVKSSMPNAIFGKFLMFFNKDKSMSLKSTLAFIWLLISSFAFAMILSLKKKGMTNADAINTNKKIKKPTRTFFINKIFPQK